jgi:AcrR family transcriptional regulator
METGTSDPRTGPRWHRRKEARPGEILAAALDSFVELGYESSRLEDIARRAGCTKGTIFLYYENKAELFKAAIREVMLPLIRDSERTIEQHAGSCRELLEKLLRMRWEGTAASRMSGLAKLLFAETHKYPELARFYHDEIHAQGQALLRRVLDMGIERGEFRPMNSASVARVAIAPIMLAGIWRQSFEPVAEHVTDSEEDLRTALDVLFGGIVAEAVPERAHA